MLALRERNELGLLPRWTPPLLRLQEAGLGQSSFVVPCRPRWRLPPLVGCSPSSTKTMRLLHDPLHRRDRGQTIEGSTVVEASLGRSVDASCDGQARGEAWSSTLVRAAFCSVVLRGANSDEGYWEMLPERIIAPALGIKPTFPATTMTTWRVQTSFGWAARREGRVPVDKAAYACAVPRHQRPQDRSVSTRKISPPVRAGA